jgi:hypothetical protein
MNLNRHSLAYAIVLALTAPFVLAACGGGSSGGMVRSPAPSAPPPVAPPPTPPPAPPATSLGPCPMPITGDCVVTSSGTMLEGRDSEQRLRIALSTGELRLGSSDPAAGSDAVRQASYRFAGGTIVESGSLVIAYGNTLRSNLEVRREGSAKISGIAEGSLTNDGSVLLYNEFRGDVLNRGSLFLYGVIDGDVVNHGMFDVNADVYFEPSGAWPFISTNSIYGHYSASAESTTSVALACPVDACLGGLLVSGRADVAGTLSLREYTDAWGPYPLTSLAPYLIVHADGGVFGSFDRWTSPGLFIEGSLRYGSHDVWFDLTSISLQAGATANGLGSGLILASAGNIDHAIQIASTFGTPAAAAQRSFVNAANRLLWMQDPAQATRALDSLSGAVHADALHSTSDGASLRTAIGAHLDHVVPGKALGSWMLEDGAGAISGVDQWLGPHLLAGVHASQRAATDASSAGGNDLAAGGYLRWFGDQGWYAGMDASAVQRTLSIGRTIDFGNDGRWQARSRRSMDAASLSVEAGKRLPVFGGQLTPFVGAGLGTVHAGAMAEDGSSGFELQLADTHLSNTRATAGVRFSRDWHWGDRTWLRLQLATGLDRAHWNGAQQAAFIGVPDAWFDLPVGTPGVERWASLGLQGSWGRGWAWSAARSSGHAFGGDQPWRLTLRRAW